MHVAHFGPEIGIPRLRKWLRRWGDGCAPLSVLVSGIDVGEPVDPMMRRPSRIGLAGAVQPDRTPARGDGGVELVR